MHLVKIDNGFYNLEFLVRARAKPKSGGYRLHFSDGTTVTVESSRVPDFLALVGRLQPELADLGPRPAGD
jgi:hypothetical protein